MRQATRMAVGLLTLGLAACGGDDPESQLRQQAHEACVGLGSAAEACNCFVDGLMDTLEDDEVEELVQVFTAGQADDLEAISDDPGAAAQLLTRMMVQIVPIAARCQVELEFGSL